MQVVPGRAYCRRSDGKAGRQVTVSLTGGRLHGPATLNVEGGNFAETTDIEPLPEGRDSISIALPEGVAVENTAEVSFTLETAGQVLQRTVSIAPLRQWTVYIYPHSHVDIGYTAPQETVKKLHMRNIDVGIDIAKKTAEYPEGAKFVWNPEVTWDQKAFYWVAPDMKTRIFFMQGWPYGYGFLIKGAEIYGLEKIQTYTSDLDRLRTDDPTANFLDPYIFDETAKLEEANHPYEIFVMTGAMADNALIDADLPEAVRLWNEKYAYPKLVIAGTDEILAEFERRYSDIIPEAKGDYTEYWTDGQGTDARRGGMNRCAKERLVQTEILRSMLHRNEKAPLEAFKDSWRYVLLGSEHTWGYWNPEDPLAKGIEATKASYFEKADKTSRGLLESTLSSIAAPGSNSIAVLNTQSWNALA